MRAIALSAAILLLPAFAFAQQRTVPTGSATTPAPGAVTTGSVAPGGTPQPAAGGAATGDRQAPSGSTGATATGGPSGGSPGRN